MHWKRLLKHSITSVSSLSTKKFEQKQHCQQTQHWHDKKKAETQSKFTTLEIDDVNDDFVMVGHYFVFICGWDWENQGHHSDSE